MLSVASVDYVVTPVPPVISHSRPDLIVALYDALHLAIARGTGLVVEYATAGTAVKTRTIFPCDLDTTSQRDPDRPVADLLHAADSLRPGIVTFRVDRIRRVLAFVQ